VNEDEFPDGSIYVFNGGGNFPSGIFSSPEKAEEWISANGLTGILTEYAVDFGAYDWSIRNGHFRPSKPKHETADFIGRFGSGSQHNHYENGNHLHDVKWPGDGTQT